MERGGGGADSLSEMIIDGVQSKAPLPLEAIIFMRQAILPSVTATFPGQTSTFQIRSFPSFPVFSRGDEKAQNTCFYIDVTPLILPLPHPLSIPTTLPLPPTALSLNTTHPNSPHNLTPHEAQRCQQAYNSSVIYLNTTLLNPLC